MANHTITDSGFWIALFEPRDQHHQSAVAWGELIEGHRILIPWPCLYETLNTRFMRRRDYLAQLESFFKKANVTLVDDSPYKEQALKSLWSLGEKAHRSFSLVDLVVREILSDTDFKIDYLVTFNAPDFQDVCSKRDIEILQE